MKRSGDPGSLAMQMWMSAHKAPASVAVGSVRTCPALSAVFARLASEAHHVKRMWMNVLKSHRPVGQAAATTHLAPFTVPVLLASAPGDQGPPAKVRCWIPSLLHHHLPWRLGRVVPASSLFE